MSKGQEHVALGCLVPATGLWVECLSGSSHAGWSCGQQPPLLSAAARPAATPLTAQPRCRHLLLPLQTALHWGYIPAIIAVGMLTTEPRPSWVQLLGPM
jgi:hypothetical protein